MAAASIARCLHRRSSGRHVHLCPPCCPSLFLCRRPGYRSSLRHARGTLQRRMVGGVGRCQDSQIHASSDCEAGPQTAQRRVKRVQAGDSVQRKQHCERGSEHQTVREAQCERDLIKLTSSLDLSRQNRPHSGQPCSAIRCCEFDRSAAITTRTTCCAELSRQSQRTAMTPTSPRW